MFNSPSSGYVLTAAESARIAEEIPAVCATKEGAFQPANSRRLHELAPELQIWECDTTVYRAGWLGDGVVCAAQLGTAGYLMETPQRRLFSEYWNLVWDGKLIEAMDVVHLLPGPPGILHALGRRVQVRGIGARSADRRLPAFTASAGGSPRRREGADPRCLRAPRTHRRVTFKRAAEGDTDRCTVSPYLQLRIDSSR
jgi:hypothetical protein